MLVSCSSHYDKNIVSLLPLPVKADRYAPLSANIPLSGILRVCNPVGKLCTIKLLPPLPSVIVRAPAELPNTTICLILDLAGPMIAAASP